MAADTHVAIGTQNPMLNRSVQSASGGDIAGGASTDFSEDNPMRDRNYTAATRHNGAKSVAADI